MVVTSHLHREIERLKEKLLSLSAIVEEQVHRAVKALHERDADVAGEVLRVDDDEVDKAEVDVEEDCLKVLALYQPVAADLRFIVAVLKINSDLERIGDMAVNIAERAGYLANQEPVDLPFDFGEMAGKAQSMLRRSLDALVNVDPELGQQVCADDDEVDILNRQMYDQVQQRIREHPQHVEYLMHFLAVSRHLERIADHATNIAEDVIYMVTGQIVRHKAEDYSAQF